MRSRRKGITRTVTIDTEVEVDVSDVLEELSDEQLIEELKSRRAEVDGSTPFGTLSGDPRKIAEDVASHLMCRRYQAAHARVRDLMTALVPAEVIDVLDAIEAQDWGTALCRADRLLEAPPSALPQKREATSCPARR
jgi:hypothetical protein